MPMSESRNVSLGVNYRLWQILVQQGWFVQYVGVSLTLLTGNDELTNVAIPANTYQYADNPKAFVFLNIYGELETGSVVVYVNNAPYSSSNYAVDYLNGRITFNSPPPGSVTADLTIHTAQVRRGYPDEHELEFIDLPVVAYQCESDDGQPFLIGTTIQEQRRYFNVFVMARNDGEREDLMFDVRTNIRFIPYVDYSLHQPLNENYALDTDYLYADQLVSRMFVQHGIQGTNLTPKPGGSDKERYRSLIAFEITRIS